MAYSLDLRRRIVEAVEEGQKHQDVAARFKVGVATVRRYLSRSRAGELAAKAPPGRSALIPAEAYGLLGEQVKQHNDAILVKHCELWEEQQGVKVSVVAMCRTMQRAGLSRKKDAESE
jgi:putative transposase